MQEIEDAAKACVCGNLRRASTAITQFYDKQLVPSGITITQLGLLRIVKLADTIKAIEKANRLASVMMNEIINKMDLSKKESYGHRCMYTLHLL
jgi:hypothetical protein